MDDWLDTINRIYQILQITINFVKAISKIRNIMPKDYIVTEIKEDLQNGELHFGDQISVIGTFSEYVPFADPKFILKKTVPNVNALTHTTRLQPIDDIYCGALFPPDQTDAFSKQTLPIFYDTKSRMLEHVTGEMLAMKCRLTQVPLVYREIIKEKDWFTFEKEDSVNISFGLEVLKVEPYGLVDSFKINPWVVGHMNLFPRRKYIRTCVNCSSAFAFMRIDPVDFPPKYACASQDASLDPTFRGPIKKWTKEFPKIEKSGIPHIVFPDIFSLFKIIYPNVDIFNKQQTEHSQNVLTTAIRKNLRLLFYSHPAVFPNFKIPKKIQCNVDFQYDQIGKIADQTFDPKTVPEWTCPNYRYDPNWWKKPLKRKRRARIRK